MREFLRSKKRHGWVWGGLSIRVSLTATCAGFPMTSSMGGRWDLSISILQCRLGLWIWAGAMEFSVWAQRRRMRAVWAFLRLSGQKLRVLLGSVLLWVRMLWA